MHAHLTDKDARVEIQLKWERASKTEKEREREIDTQASNQRYLRESSTKVSFN